jgi:hypothetical protein
MGVDFNQDFDYEGEDDLALGSPNESRPMACSISTLNVPTPFESIATTINLD